VNEYLLLENADDPGVVCFQLKAPVTPSQLKISTSGGTETRKSNPNMH
jgi:hypothetical protein